MQTATIGAYRSGKVSQNRKEDHFNEEYAAIADGRAVVVARFYYTKCRAYCCIWLRGVAETHGGGWAGGYGYCRASASFEAACDDAGIALSRPVAGVGMGAVEDAILAIARAMGHDAFIHHAHA